MQFVESLWWRRALAIVAGVLLALSFPKMGIAGFAWLAPGLLLFAARQGNPFRTAYLGGFVHYLISLSWLLHIPVRFYPILGWIALAAYLALYPAFWAWLVARVMPVLSDTSDSSKWWKRTVFSLFAAAAWVACEMTVARMFTGFPWNLLGASQYRMLPLLQVASVTGIYGVSFLIVWFSVSLAFVAEALVAGQVRRHLFVKELAVPALAIAILYAMGWRVMATTSNSERFIRTALIQPSIPQTRIWNPAEADERFAELLRLTTAALTNRPELLIWPEAAVPKMVRDDVATLRSIAALARTNQVWIIIGSDDFDLRGTNVHYFNSSFLVSPEGELVSTYRKRRLVIFGEYVPLVRWLPFVKYFTPITGGFTAGDQPVSFDLGALRARTSVLICFEDVFPHYAREHATDDIDFLVNITNDGWFGESAAQWQHAASAVFRAIENGLPLVRCANNGLSCWVDRHGGLHDAFFPGSQDIYQAGFKITEVPVMRRKAATFYTRHGDWFGWMCVSVTLLEVIRRTPPATRKSRAAVQSM